MASSQLHSGADAEPASPVDDYTPTFYVGHHESKRPLPVTDFVLRQAQDVGVSAPRCTEDQMLMRLSMICSPVPSQAPISTLEFLLLSRPTSLNCQTLVHLTMPPTASHLLQLYLPSTQSIPLLRLETQFLR